MYGWIPLLSTWNYHSNVNLLYFQYKIKKKTFKVSRIYLEKQPIRVDSCLSKTDEMELGRKYSAGFLNEMMIH